jgi:hypothetical protein
MRRKKLFFLLFERVAAVKNSEKPLDSDCVYRTISFFSSFARAAARKKI